AAELRRQLSDLPPVRELAVDGFGVIAEVKFRAPSVTGPLGQPSPEEAVRQAKAYERGNATAISVLTCPEGFDGHIDHMRAVAKAVPLPVMRKDFLVDPNQIFEARLAGASGVLLIARILDDLPAMLQAAGEAGLFSLVEVFDEDDISKLPSNLVSDGPVLLGVNSRCLDTLQVKPQRHKDLRTRLPKGFLTVAESGLTGAEDAATAARNGYELVLVGSALMKGGEPAEAVRAMLEAGKTAGVTPCT
ncbi:MAG: indole-3-glycerol-phosphate synthase, partial [Myxococcota bacterium]